MYVCAICFLMTWTAHRHCVNSPTNPQLATGPALLGEYIYILATKPLGRGLPLGAGGVGVVAPLRRRLARLRAVEQRLLLQQRGGVLGRPAARLELVEGLGGLVVG
jgi:hypothetical protein